MIDSTLKNANILIVDDKQANIDVLIGLLEMLGYANLHATTDPRLVAGLFKSLNPDLMLLDLMMPYLDGFEVMDLLKTLIPANTYLPILVLTADMAVETKQRALAGGAKDFLAKPFDLVEVGLRIQNLLESRLLHQLLQNQNQILEEKVKERTIELETANKELETANKELKGLDQAKVDFLQLISHEIRTPLNGIKGFLDILKSEIQSPELLEYLQFLDDSVARLEIFSYQALMITELRTRKTHIQIEEVPLRELFDKTAKQLQEKLRTKNINVSLINDSGLNIIPGNRQLLQVCFDCLINNAIQYSPPNDVVIVKVYPDDTFIVCEFIDKGPGFSSTALDHLFKLFWVGKEHVDQNRGLNLGLVKLIMDAHNGQIAVVNNQPNGAIVRMTFPT